MNFCGNVPKGLHVALEERGVDTHNMNADQMRAVLGSHPDFKNEKSRVEQFLMEKEHIVYLLPKYHCELNPIERVWAQSKKYTKAYQRVGRLSMKGCLRPTHSVCTLESRLNSRSCSKPFWTPSYPIRTFLYSMIPPK